MELSTLKLTLDDVRKWFPRIERTDTDKVTYIYSVTICGNKKSGSKLINRASIATRRQSLRGDLPDLISEDLSSFDHSYFDAPLGRDYRAKQRDTIYFEAKKALTAKYEQGLQANLFPFEHPFVTAINKM